MSRLSRTDCLRNRTSRRVPVFNAPPEGTQANVPQAEIQSMTETTTIQVTKEQRKELHRLREQGGYRSLKAVIAELLETGEITVAGVDEAQARSIAQDVVNDMVTYKALQE